MKSINKKLYSVIVVCLLVLCFSVSVLATESSIPTTPNNSSQPSEATPSTPSGENNSEVSSPEGEGTSSEFTDISSNTSDIASNDGSSDVNSTESTPLESSDVESNESTNSNITNVSDVSSRKTSSKKQSNHGNVGGYVDDEADTSGWGDEESSELVSAGTTEKKDDKKITDYSSLLWILIWIPVLLIIGSVGALVYVNRKAFLEQEGSLPDFDDTKPPKRRKLSAAEKAKRKNNHKNRTNVYKPRD